MKAKNWFVKSLESRNYDSIVFGSSESSDKKFKVIVKAGIFEENGINKVCLLDIFKQDIDEGDECER